MEVLLQVCHMKHMSCWVSKKDMLVVLNDNEMSISPNVGAMNKYLTKILWKDPINY